MAFFVKPPGAQTEFRMLESPQGVRGVPLKLC